MNSALSGVLLFTLIAAQAPAQEAVPPSAQPAIPLRGQPAHLPSADEVYDSTTVDAQPMLVAAGAHKYPEHLERAGKGGTVSFQFIIDTLGRADSASVRTIQSTNSDFQAAALTLLLTSRWQPAVKDGRRVAMRTQQVITFKP